MEITEIRTPAPGDESMNVPYIYVQLCVDKKVLVLAIQAAEPAFVRTRNCIQRLASTPNIDQSHDQGEDHKSRLEILKA